MRFLIPCGLLLLSGCAPSATTPENTAISPGPVASGPTVAPVATAAPVAAAPTTATATRPANTGTRSQFTPAERTWLDAALATARQVDTNSIRGSGTPLQQVTAAHTTLRQTVAKYTPVRVPPKFAKADAYFRQGFAEDEQAYTAMEAAARARDNNWMTAGQSHYHKAADLYLKARTEVMSHLPH